jgi:hypothetical protein
MMVSRVLLNKQGRVMEQNTMTIHFTMRPQVCQLLKSSLEVNQSGRAIAKYKVTARIGIQIRFEMISPITPLRVVFNSIKFFIRQII